MSTRFMEACVSQSIYELPCCIKSIIIIIPLFGMKPQYHVQFTDLPCDVCVNHLFTRVPYIAVT